jgi:hypothetical protein
VSFLKLLARNRLALAGLIVMGVVILAILTPLLPLAPPDVTDTANRFQPPFSEGALLGTDHLGRDLLSRLMWGTRLSLAVGFAAAIIAATLGAAIGIVAGYYGGRTDNVIMRGVDMLMAFPYILLALAIVAALGPGLMNALIAVAAVNIPFFARNIRGVTVSIAQQGVRRRGQARRHVGRADHPDRDPAQRDPGDRDRHVDDHRLDDPGDGGAVVPRARLAAAAGRSGLDAGRGALGADHQSAHLRRAGRDDPDHRDGDQPAGRRGARRARPAAALGRAEPADAGDAGGRGPGPAGREAEAVLAVAGSARPSFT